jgi:hypothetical protein
LSETEIQTVEETHDCARCGAGYAGGDSCPSCGLLREPVPCEGDASRQARARCVICGRAVCDGDGGDDDAPARCEEHRTVPIIEGWSQVYSTTTEYEGQLVVENLRAEGIDAQIYAQRDHSFPVDIGELAIARVLVPVWEHQQALEIIRSYMDTEGEVVFACPGCGEVYEPGAETCTSCGAPLSASSS